MSEDIEIREIDGVDEVRFQPSGVCSKLFSLKVKDNTANYLGYSKNNFSNINFSSYYAHNQESEIARDLSLHLPDEKHHGK